MAPIDVYLCPRCYAWHVSHNGRHVCGGNKVKYHTYDDAVAGERQRRLDLAAANEATEQRQLRRRRPSAKPIVSGEKRRVIRKGEFPGQHIDPR